MFVCICSNYNVVVRFLADCSITIAEELQSNDAHKDTFLKICAIEDLKEDITGRKSVLQVRREILLFSYEEEM